MPPKPMEMLGIRRICQPSSLNRFCENHGCYAQCNYWGEESCSSSRVLVCGWGQKWDMNAIRAATAATQDHQFMIVSRFLRQFTVSPLGTDYSST